MKFNPSLTLGSALIVLSLAAACDRQPGSELDIVRGRPLGPDSPALHNVVGLSRDGLSVFCTGSVVADDMIVTAAHCVESIPKFSVVFGPPNGLMKRVEVSKVENYKPYGSAAFPNFDIAWIRLKTKVPEGFRPMEILRDPARLKEAKEFRLAGYGIEKTNCQEESCQDELLEVNTSLDQYFDTARLMSLLSFKGPEELGMGGSCSGDSGGPAYARIDDRWYLIGVTNGKAASITPETFVDRSKACETGSSVYTFMGDYVPWLEKRSSQELLQTDAVNPDRSELPLVLKGEEKPADAMEPQSWAEWLQYPYHNEQAWNTVERLVWDLWAIKKGQLKLEDQVKLWVDPEFSQAQVHEITSYDVQLEAFDELRFAEQAYDLRPLASWAGLETVRIQGSAAAYSVEAISRLPALKTLTLTPGPLRVNGALDLSALQKLGTSLEHLHLINFTAAELKTLPFAALKQLQSLEILAQSDRVETPLDLSGLQSLQTLKIRSWPYSAAMSLPVNLALQNLDLKLDHVTDLKWLDIESIKSIHTLDVGAEVLANPAVISRFHHKGLRKLVVPSNRLTSEHLPAPAFADVEQLVLSGNQISSTDFMKEFPVLKAADMRDNPLLEPTCPTGISCSFDRVFNPQTVADFCRNTTDSNDYSYKTIIQMLLMAQNLPYYLYNERTCDSLQNALSQVKSLVLDGDNTWSLPNGLNYDLRVLQALPELRSLRIRKVSLAHAEALAALPNLSHLDLGSVKTKGLEFIPLMAKLENLNYSEFPGTNLEALSHPNLKVLTLNSEGPRVVLGAGRVTTIGARTKLPALTKLSLRGNPLQDLMGLESMKALSELDISETRVVDLSPLQSLIGTRVYFGGNYTLDTCPILYGSCQTGSANIGGASFGADTNSLQGSKWMVGQQIPGLGKALR
jgi:Leucine-rich repeat (LRR) protein